MLPLAVDAVDAFRQWIVGEAKADVAREGARRLVETAERVLHVGREQSLVVYKLKSPQNTPAHVATGTRTCASNT